MFGYFKIWMQRMQHNVSSFSYSAWLHSWLRRFERRWQYVYTCIKANPCDCDSNDLGDGWYLVEKIPTYVTREVTN